ncbi:MAG: hypothetical protein GQ527_00205 [Bacteroidales bacterium]|nr:hypothetical protein [Bacteroidales bacterium]
MKIALVSDIHEDVVQLKKALRIIEKKKCDEVVCLGDILGYSSLNYDFSTTKNASECIQLVKSHCSNVILGNHDLFVIKRIPKYRADFNYTKNWYQLNIDERVQLAKEKLWDYSFDKKPNLSDTDLEYLNSLNEVEVVDDGNEKILFTHFIYPNISGSATSYPKSKADFTEHFNFMNEQECKTSFFGHGHYNGALITNKNKMRIRNFGVFELKENINCISVPCIVSGKQKNGLLIYDHKNRQIETIKL